MKKISPRKYAVGLYEAVKEKSKDEVDLIIENFLKILLKNNDFSLADKIVAEFSAYFKEQEGIIEAEVVTARKLSAEEEKELSQSIKGQLAAKEIELVNKVDKSILGGLIIRFKDKLFDGSLKNRLEALKINLTK